jgi:transmembrane sensor
MTDIGFDGERISRFFKGAFTEEDAEYVSRIFLDKTHEKRLDALLARQFDEPVSEDESDNLKLDNILYRIHYEINTRQPVNKVRPFDNILKWATRIAGILILPFLVFVGLQTYKEVNQKKEAWVEIKAPAWTRAQFCLPDGTTGWLNSNSSIKYNGTFVSDRQVKLDGEAFFDVYKDKRRPFIVTTPEINIKVLGTRFNVASYDNEKSVEVVLEEGKLIFSNKDNSKSYTMKPNDLVVYNKTADDYSIEEVQPQKYVSWTEGKLVFRNDPLDVVARRLERWYNIDVEVNVNSSESPRWRATFIDENLEEVLYLLKCSGPIDYSIENQDQQPDDTYTRKKVTITLKNN